MIIAIFTVLGLFVGSFLNVCIDRLPRRQSIVTPPSHCPVCGRRLKALDLLPLVSYLFLRGACRSCRAPIPRRVPVVEAGTALIFSFLYWNYGPGLELAVLLIYSCILIVIFVIDLEHQLVLNVISYPAMLLAFAFSFFWPGIRTISFVWPQSGVESALLGGITGAIMLGIPYFLARKRGGMGFGDIKLGILLGLMTGYPLVIMTILMSWIGGGVIAILLLALKIKKRDEAIPFAPFLVTSALVTLFWGKAILEWYL